MTEPVVEFRRVSKSYGRVRAVDGVSFAVERGECFALLGPSGCGKTTTLRLLAGLETPDPDGGDVRLLGAVANDTPPWERPVAMVFQNYALFPHLDVARNVGFGLVERRVPKAEAARRVARALELVRLDPATFGRRRPAELSGGQRQRVALARALVIEPQVLLLDEPLGALDLRLRKEMQLELKALNRQLGITFVFVTHDQEEALVLADRIAVMNQARVAQVGAPREIYERPRTEFVARFIGECNIFAGEGGGSTAVRPERVTLRRAEAGGPGGVHGVVRDGVYLGGAVHVLVDLDAGGTARVALHNDGGALAAWPAGTRVVLSWPADAAAPLEA